MKINMNNPITDLNNNIIKAQDGKDCTIGFICVDALCNPDKETTGKEKFKRFELAMKINTNEIVNLSAEEIVLLKDLIGKNYAPIVVGRSWTMLEGI